MQALFHFEAIRPQPKQVDIDFLESLVVKYIIPNPENPNIASATDREELSSIFLEVNCYKNDFWEKWIFLDSWLADIWVKDSFLFYFEVLGD